MSVIFFEGFNRALDLNYWTLTASSDQNSLPSFISDVGGARTNGRYMLGSSSTYAATQSTLSVKFSPATLTETLTKVYIGFAIDRVYGQRANLGGTTGAKQKVFTIYDGSDVELFNIAARNGTGGLALSLYSNNYFSGNFEIGSFIITSVTNIGDAIVNIDGNGNYISGWNYLEFEIDLESNTFAARRNGQTLYTENTGALTVLLPVAMPSIGAFKFHGNSAAQSSVDDMYVATSAGDTANTWLGPDTRVYSPVFSASTPAEWSISPLGSSSATAINADDADNSFISTNDIDKVNVFDTVVSPSPSNAIVGGIKLSSVARKVTLDAAYRHVYKHTDDAIHDLSPKFNLTTTTTATAYKRSSAFVFENPVTILPWTITELDNGKFGVKSVAYEPGAARTPTFGSTTSTATGFTVQISNYDADYTWAGAATASGTVTINRVGLVTVTGVAAGISSTATITTINSNGASLGNAIVTAPALAAALTPAFGTTTATADGFTVVISNYDSAYTWAGMATASGSVGITDNLDGTGLATITGVATNTSSTATITTTQTGYAGGSTTTSAVTSLNTALTPTFGTPVKTADGFTVQIANYNTSYAWAGTATASGTVVISGSGLITVTGVTAGTSSTATITTTKAGYVIGSAATTATSLAAALTPAFGTPTATSGGFTVQIENYNATYTWAGTANASVSIDNTGLVAVTGVAVGTSSTATITTTKANTVGGSNTVTQTSVMGAALNPTFGTTTSTANGFTVQINNHNALYTWAGTATAFGTVAIGGFGLVTVTGVAPGTSSTVTITTTRTGYTGGTNTSTATSVMGAALTPTFGSTTPTADGFTVQINNYNSNDNNTLYTWDGTATASGLVAISGSGLITVTGVAAGTSSIATITTTRTGYIGGTANVTETSVVGAALTPTFGSTTRTATGFTVQINNYNSNDNNTLYTWAGTATASGSVSVSVTGLVTVTGVAAGTSSIATITTTRTGYIGGTNTSTATSLAAARTPAFGSTTSTADGFTVQIAEYNASYTWAGTATASGLVAISGSGLITVTGVAAGISSTATITTTRSGYVSGSNTVIATSLAAARTPAFDETPTATADGFTVYLTNFDDTYAWAGTATASGTVSIDNTGLVTVTGVAALTSSTATITTTKAGTVGGSNTVMQTSLVGAALTPTFGNPTATADGFTVQISNYNASYTWAGTATASGLVAIDGNGLVTVTGVAAATSSTATITTTKVNTVGGSATTSAVTSLNTALTPTFGNPTATADGFTVQINNYTVDSNNTLYTWGSSVTSGSVAISGSGLITVTGVAAGTSSIATITTTRTGYVSGSNTSTATSLAAALTPDFGNPTSTSGGFTVQINNYNINSNNTLYTWAGTATASGSVSINGSGLVTVRGVAPVTSSTVTITTTRPGYPDGSAATTATSGSVSISPNLNSPQARSNGSITVIFTAAFPANAQPYNYVWSITGTNPPSNFSSSGSNTQSITFTSASTAPHFNVTCNASNMMGAPFSGTYTGYEIT